MTDPPPPPRRRFTARDAATWLVILTSAAVGYAIAGWWLAVALAVLLYVVKAYFVERH